MSRRPRYLYHASPECVYDSIMQDGLVRSWGAVFASEKPEHCLNFMSFRLIDHVHGSEMVEIQGTKHRVPNIVSHDVIYVWKIDTYATDNKWERGEDHSAAFFGEATSWETHQDVPRWALVEVQAFGRVKDAVRETETGSTDSPSVSDNDVSVHSDATAENVS